MEFKKDEGWIQCPYCEGIGQVLLENDEGETEFSTEKTGELMRDHWADCFKDDPNKDDRLFYDVEIGGN